MTRDCFREQFGALVALEARLLREGQVRVAEAIHRIAMSLVLGDLSAETVATLLVLDGIPS